MPPTSINLDPFQDEIELQVAAGHTQSIREWLNTKGVIVSKNTFQRWITAWKAGRQSKASVYDIELILAMNTIFHATQYDDKTITQEITHQGIFTT